MVAFGGIAGLFLGCSILSSIEIIYYLMELMLIYGRKLKVHLENVSNSYSNRIKVGDSSQNNSKKLGKKRKFSENVRVIKIQPLSDIDKSVRSTIKTRY